VSKESIHNGTHNSYVKIGTNGSDGGPGFSSVIYVISAGYGCGIDTAYVWGQSIHLGAAGKFLAIRTLRGNQRVIKRKIREVSTNRAKETARKGEVDRRFTTIRGILVPTDWDEDGNALAVAVSTLGENEYVVEPDSKGQELLRLLRQEVEVVGLVKKGRNDRRVITVKSYALSSG